MGRSSRFKRRRRVQYHADGSRTIPLDAEARGAIYLQLEAFVQKFGRRPRGGEPLFFDPDQDTPQFMNEGQIRRLTDDLEFSMVRAGVQPEIIHAFRKTGRIVTADNEDLLTDADIEEWNAAIEEYRANEKAELV